MFDKLSPKYSPDKGINILFPLIWLIIFTPATPSNSKASKLQFSRNSCHSELEGVFQLVPQFSVAKSNASTPPRSAISSFPVYRPNELRILYFSASERLKYGTLAYFPDLCGRVAPTLHLAHMTLKPKSTYSCPPTKPEASEMVSFEELLALLLQLLLHSLMHPESQPEEQLSHPEFVLLFSQPSLQDEHPVLVLLF
jgi:hypothetical protein